MSDTTFNPSIEGPFFTSTEHSSLLSSADGVEMLRDFDQRSLHRTESESNGNSIYADKDNQILRLLCSDVAAIAGYNGYKNKIDLFHKYLYQDLKNLLVLDAKNVGVEIIEKEQEIENIILKLTPPDREKLASLQKRATSYAVRSDASASSALIGEIKTLLTSENVKKVVDETSLGLLEGDLVGGVSKR